MAKAVLSEKGGCIFLSLFGVPFFVAGSLILYFMVISPLQTLQNSQNWPEVNVQILELKFLKEAEPLSVEYSYVYNGQNYKSRGLYLDTDLPDLLSQKAIYPVLKRSLDSGHSISAFVNPEFPDQAVLFKELKDELLTMSIFGGIFALVGLGVILGGIFMYKSASQKEFYRRESPEKPWMWDKTWRQGVSKPERKSNLIIGFIFLCFWFGMTAVLTLVLYDDFLEGEVVFYISSGMALFGGLFIYFYIKNLLKYKKFGQSYMELKTLPGRLGKEFKGEIYAPFFLRPEGNIHFSVDCKHHYSEGTGDSRRSKTDLLYKDEFSINPDSARSIQEAFVIPVAFTLPKDKPASDNDIFWTLNVYASTVGLDWSETYKIPVFK